LEIGTKFNLGGNFIMASGKTNKWLDFFGIGTDQDYEDEEVDNQNDFEVSTASARRSRKDRVSSSSTIQEDYDDEETNLFGVPKRKSKLIPIQGKNSGDGRRSVIIYAPVSYNESQKLVVQLKLNKQLIVKLEALDIDIAQRILDFMSGAAYALEAQVTKISKGIYLFASNDTEIEKKDSAEHEKVTADGFYTLDDSQDRYSR